MNPWLLVLASTLIVGGVGPPADAEAPASVMASVRHHGCGAGCPDYRIVVYTDGSVLYQGVYAVTTVGEVWEHLTPERLALIRDAFADARFFSLRDDYASLDQFDLPGVDVYYREGDREKVVHDYFGDRRRPRLLNDLSMELDAVINARRWLHGERRTLGDLPSVNARLNAPPPPTPAPPKKPVVSVDPPKPKHHRRAARHAPPAQAVATPNR